jgi:hypothetical protein
MTFTAAPFERAVREGCSRGLFERAVREDCSRGLFERAVRGESVDSINLYTDVK